ncbi:hypothetical protein LC048_00540 [Mesobacillus subterraneus]|uniref:hypothetical protein n=1 Tax=Mesobacillus subterraneus TaxID=285983 RepID=UPI001CFE6129|nr:hypothetical protein [Mesobacillus subterraneus]WLR55545.1 hypothetical protein LC048_00540 [Mesobacillus subterraneus]
MNNTELRELSLQLLDNILNRVIQLSSNPKNSEKELKERLIFLIEDLDILIKSVNILDKDFELREINYIFQSMLESMENEDYYSLKDMLKYELIPLLEHWKGVFNNE